MEQIRAALEAVGDWTDAEPLVRGVTFAGLALVAGAGLAWRVLRGRREAPQRTRVHVDAPAGEHVRVEAWGRDKDF